MTHQVLSTQPSTLPSIPGEETVFQETFLSKVLAVVCRILEQQGQQSLDLKEQKQHKTREFQKLSIQSSELLVKTAYTTFYTAIGSLFLGIANIHLQSDFCRLSSEQLFPQMGKFIESTRQAQKQSYDYEINYIFNELNSLNTEKQTQSGQSEQANQLLQAASQATRAATGG